MKPACFEIEINTEKINKSAKGSLGAFSILRISYMLEDAMENNINYFYLDFNVTGADRRRLVKAISDFTGADAEYHGAPTFTYTVDYFTIDHNGVVSFDDRADSEEIEALLEKLVNEGFVSQVSNLGCEPKESENEETESQAKNKTGGIKMDAYFKELTRRLNSAGIQTDPPEKDRLPILWNGEAVIFGALASINPQFNWGSIKML